MKRRNPQSSPHRASSWHDTNKRVEQYYGKAALLATWEQQPAHVLIREHAYLLKLRQHVRQVKNYVMHRADPAANL